MRIIFGVLLGLLMVLVAMFAISMDEQARAPDGSMVFELRECETMFLTDLVTIRLARHATLHDGVIATVASAENNMKNPAYMNETSSRIRDARCLEVINILKCPSPDSTDCMRGTARSNHYGLLPLTGERERRTGDM